MSNTPDAALATAAGESLVHVVRELLGWEVMASPEVRGAPGAGWRASVSLRARDWEGVVALEFSDRFASEALQWMLGDPGDAAGARDFAGELVNMVAGRMAVRLESTEGTCRLGTPDVRRREDPETQEGDSSVAGRTDWNCAGHSLSLRVRSRQFGV